MRIALASMPVINRDIAFNLSTITACIKECSQKADVLVFGESVLQGFDCLCWNYEEDRKTAIELSDELITKICEAAKENELAVSLGFIERVGEALYSSQLFVGKDGRIINVFHRVSVGWKEYDKTDEHYLEGDKFESFQYEGRSFAIGLCGDLWTDGRPKEMKKLNADIVLWPVWCDYNTDEWNSSIKYEYAEQAALCGDNVLLVNPYCIDKAAEDVAAGGAVYFRKGVIDKEISSGRSGYLFVEI